MNKVAIRLVEDYAPMGAERVESIEDALEVICEEFTDYDKECLIAINIDENGKVINYNVVSMGTSTRVYCSPKEILKSTILSNANGLIIVHNHPTGNLEPSDGDFESTRMMENACNIIGIMFMDHVLVANGEYVSIKYLMEEGD